METVSDADVKELPIPNSRVWTFFSAYRKTPVISFGTSTHKVQELTTKGL